MKKRLAAGKVILALFIFSPLALVPTPVRGAFLPSETFLSRPPGGEDRLVTPPDRMERAFRFLSEKEIGLLSRGGIKLYRGGQHSSPLSTNETAAIVLTLIILGVMVGFVEQNR